MVSIGTVESDNIFWVRGGDRKTCQPIGDRKTCHQIGDRKSRHQIGDRNTRHQIGDTPPLKKNFISNRTNWSHILDFKIGAFQGYDWLKTKKSDGPF